MSLLPLATAPPTENLHPVAVNGHDSCAQAGERQQPVQYAASHDWNQLLVRRGGRIVPDERNVLIALRNAPELQAMVGYNEFEHRAVILRSPPWRTGKAQERWTDHDDTSFREWLQSKDIAIAQRTVAHDCIELVATEHRFHPVRTYLTSLVHDEQPRLKTWLSTYLGASGDESTKRYLEDIGVRFMIGCVARIMEPGCQQDHTLVLEGPQGLGKSRAVRILARVPAWFSDSVPDLSKEGQVQLQGKWLIELAELAALRRAEIEHLKAFLTRVTDEYRPHYGRNYIARPRQCSFIGSTNESTYLRDPSGNRRFWPVRCSRIDLDRLEGDADQLWAEAVWAYNRGGEWHLSTKDQIERAEVEQGTRVHVTEIEHDVAEYLAGHLSMGHRDVAVRSVLIYGLGLSPDDPGFAERAGRLARPVADALERNGWHRVKRMGRGAQRRTLYVYRDSPGVGEKIDA